MNIAIIIPGDILDAIMKQYPLTPLANYDDAGDENYWVERERLAAEFGYRLAQPKQEAIEDAEKFVEENFKGLSDFIEDADILIWYKALIVSAITDYQYQPKQEAIEQQGNINLDRRKIMDVLIGYFGNTELNSTLQELADEIIKTQGNINNDAVDFAEWINKNCEAWGNKWVHSAKDGKDYTTEELYKLYKNKQ